RSARLGAPDAAQLGVDGRHLGFEGPFPRREIRRRTLELSGEGRRCRRRAGGAVLARRRRALYLGLAAEDVLGSLTELVGEAHRREALPLQLAASDRVYARKADLLHSRQVAIPGDSAADVRQHGGRGERQHSVWLGYCGLNRRAG